MPGSTLTDPRPSPSSRQVLVWHTQTKQPHVPFHEVDVNKYRGTNMEVLRRIVNPR